MHNVKYSRKYKNQNDTVFKFLLYSLAPISINDILKTNVHQVYIF